MSTETIPDALDVTVSHYVRGGCYRADSALGIQKMPFGYALMLDHDEMYFFWLRYDGAEGPVHWNKWAAYRMAKMNYLHSLAALHPSPLVAATNC